MNVVGRAGMLGVLATCALAGFGTVGCATRGGAIAADRLVGAYYNGDGLGTNITLNLRDDGRYVAQWHGCLGDYGSAEGVWQVHEREVKFVPETESGMLSGYLTVMSVQRNWPQYMLIRQQDLAKPDSSRYHAFRRHFPRRD